MKQQKQQFSVTRLVFRDTAIEQRFVRHLYAQQLERLQIGFGFLVLFYMAVATAQLTFFSAPLLANLSYAGLGFVALVGFSVFNPRKLINRATWIYWVLGIFISLGSVATAFIPNISVALQITSVVIALVWLSLYSGLLYQQAGTVMLCVIWPSLAIYCVVIWPLESSTLAILAAVGLSSLFSALVGYLNERAARLNYLQQYESDGSGTRHVTAIKQDYGLQILKELTIELSALKDSDATYSRLLTTIKRVVHFDLAAVGSRQNERMFPALVRSDNNEAGCEDTIKLLWHANLINQLEKQKVPLVGPAEMGLVESVYENGEISFGHRLDIPFLSQGKLDGVVTLIRSAPVFSSSESALAASMVFHGLFANRTARMHARTDLAASKPAAARRPTTKQVLTVDAFLEQATKAFQIAETNGKPVSLILVEMDRRDFYLNRYGQKTVSRLFDVMAATLINHSPAGALLGRYGSGSFALQVPISLESARRLAEKLRLAIGKHRLTVDTEKVGLTVSIGVSARDTSAPDFLSLLRGADIGLYLARGDNGNAVRVQH